MPRERLSMLCAQPRYVPISPGGLMTWGEARYGGHIIVRAIRASAADRRLGAMQVVGKIPQMTVSAVHTAGAPQSSYS